MRRERQERVGLDEIEAIYRSRFRAFLYSVTAIVGDVDVALDALHDAFAAAIRRRESFRGDGTLEAWLWKIVINSARDHRNRHEDGTSALVSLTTNGDGPGGRDAVIRRAVAALPERQRLVVFLRYYADLDYGAIAEVLGVSPGTVGSTLNAARSELLRTLEDLEEVHR